MSRHRIPAIVLAAVLAAAAVWLVAAGRRDPVPARAAGAGVATATAAVEARRLVDREDVEGTLDFADPQTVTAAAAGTVTRLRAEGSTVRRGQSLYSIDAVAAGYVLYGRILMYRDLSAASADGGDVEQLERNLAALGHDPGEIDGDWDAATTAAVRAWEAARGATVDGIAKVSEVVIVAGAARVGAHQAEVGDRVGAGAPVTGLTSRRRVVTARLATSRQAGVDLGDAVRVTLPDGTEVRGRVTTVGRVARGGGDGEEATVALEVALRGRAARRGGLDRAPVTVSVATSATRAATAVPVTALLATGGGRYAVEVVDGGGRRRTVPVALGAFADGYAEVSGAGLRPGLRVVVPR